LTLIGCFWLLIFFLSNPDSDLKKVQEIPSIKDEIAEITNDLKKLDKCYNSLDPFLKLTADAKEKTPLDAIFDQFSVE